jgi:alpha-ribazole phosphatase
MEIHLIRHTTPLVEKGICYGQTDLDVTSSFHEEAQNIFQQISHFNYQSIISSPLQRCAKLAKHLFPEKKVSFEQSIMEINCGSWEMQHWDEIPKSELDPWMADFVNTRIPHGESYVDIYDRVTQFFESLEPLPQPIALVTHGGVIRSILSHITKTPLEKSFETFSIRYGCVVQLTLQNKKWVYNTLHNPQFEKEQHHPSK